MLSSLCLINHSIHYYIIIAIRLQLHVLLILNYYYYCLVELLVVSDESQHLAANPTWSSRCSFPPWMCCFLHRPGHRHRGGGGRCRWWGGVMSYIMTLLMKHRATNTVMSASWRLSSGSLLHLWAQSPEPGPVSGESAAAPAAAPGASDPRHMLSSTRTTLKAWAVAAEVIALEEEEKKKKKTTLTPSTTPPPFWIAM